MAQVVWYVDGIKLDYTGDKRVANREVPSDWREVLTEMGRALNKPMTDLQFRYEVRVDVDDPNETVPLDNAYGKMHTFATYFRAEKKWEMVGGVSVEVEEPEQVGRTGDHPCKYDWRGEMVSGAAIKALVERKLRE